MSRFFNVSNHPQSKWSVYQKEMAKKMVEDLPATNGVGYVVDIPFPYIDPSWSSKRLEEEVGKVLSDLLVNRKAVPERNVIHVMGEMTFTYRLVKYLQQYGFKVVASTTERKSVDDEKGCQRSWFVFMQFREY